MQTRNPIFTASGAIDCEINHPTYGWIPFTASPNDPEQHGREIFDALKDTAAPYVPPPPHVPTQEEQEFNRQAAYTQEADPLFFKWQAGEATKEEWEAKREEIRQRFPYPEGTDNE
jgi:hypothetical protein